MTFRDEISAAVARLPERFETSDHETARLVGDMRRKVFDRGRNTNDDFRRFERLVGSRSRAIEKAWYRDAVFATRDWVAAMAVLEAWSESSGYDRYLEELHRAFVSEDPQPEPYIGVAARRRKYKKLGRRLEEIGDPTAPGWRPPWRSRLAAVRHRLAVAAGNEPPEKPHRRTVHVPLKGGELVPVTALVYPDRTAQLPEFGREFPAGSSRPKAESSANGEQSKETLHSSRSHPPLTTPHLLSATRHRSATGSTRHESTVGRRHEAGSSRIRDREAISLTLPSFRAAGQPATSARSGRS